MGYRFEEVEVGDKVHIGEGIWDVGIIVEKTDHNAKMQISEKVFYIFYPSNQIHLLYKRSEHPEEFV